MLRDLQLMLKESPRCEGAFMASAETRARISTQPDESTAVWGVKWGGSQKYIARLGDLVGSSKISELGVRVLSANQGQRFIQGIAHDVHLAQLDVAFSKDDPRAFGAPTKKHSMRYEVLTRKADPADADQRPWMAGCVGLADSSGGNSNRNLTFSGSAHTELACLDLGGTVASVPRTHNSTEMRTVCKMNTYQIDTSTPPELRRATIFASSQAYLQGGGRRCPAGWNEAFGIASLMKTSTEAKIDISYPGCSLGYGTDCAHYKVADSESYIWGEPNMNYEGQIRVPNNPSQQTLLAGSEGGGAYPIKGTTIRVDNVDYSGLGVIPEPNKFRFQGQTNFVFNIDAWNASFKYGYSTQESRPQLAYQISGNYGAPCYGQTCPFYMYQQIQHNMSGGVASVALNYVPLKYLRAQFYAASTSYPNGPNGSGTRWGPMVCAGSPPQTAGQSFDPATLQLWDALSVASGVPKPWGNSRPAVPNFEMTFSPVVYLVGSMTPVNPVAGKGYFISDQPLDPEGATYSQFCQSIGANLKPYPVFVPWAVIDYDMNLMGNQYAGIMQRNSEGMQSPWSFLHEAVDSIACY